MFFLQVANLFAQFLQCVWNGDCFKSWGSWSCGGAERTIIVVCPKNLPELARFLLAFGASVFAALHCTPNRGYRSLTRKISRENCSLRKQRVSLNLLLALGGSDQNPRGTPRTFWAVWPVLALSVPLSKEMSFERHLFFLTSGARVQVGTVTDCYWPEMHLAQRWSNSQKKRKWENLGSTI